MMRTWTNRQRNWFGIFQPILMIMMCVWSSRRVLMGFSVYISLGLKHIFTQWWFSNRANFGWTLCAPPKLLECKLSWIENSDGINLEQPQPMVNRVYRMKRCSALLLLRFVSNHIDLRLLQPPPPIADGIQNENTHTQQQQLQQQTDRRRMSVEARKRSTWWQKAHQNGKQQSNSTNTNSSSSIVKAAAATHHHTPYKSNHPMLGNL